MRCCPGFHSLGRWVSGSRVASRRTHQPTGGEGPGSLPPWHSGTQDRSAGEESRLGSDSPDQPHTHGAQWHKSQGCLWGRHEKVLISVSLSRVNNSNTSNTCNTAALITGAERCLHILGCPRNLSRFFCIIWWKNSNKLSGQPSSKCHMRSVLLKSGNQMPDAPSGGGRLL